MFLWYIGNLESFRSMADRFGISKGSFHASIKRVSSALLEILPEVVKWPETPAEINETSQHFGEKSEFQNIIGAVDGSHIQIKAPKQQPHAYFNRKKISFNCSFSMLQCKNGVYLCIDWKSRKHS